MESGGESAQTRGESDEGLIILDSDNYPGQCPVTELTPGPVYSVETWNGEKISVPALLPQVTQCLKEMKAGTLREEDILLVTYPKTGTHWVWEIMMMLSKGLAEHHSESKDVTWLDWTPLSTIQSIQDMNPRPVSTHIPLHLIPESFLNERKIVYTIRNPKDALVSNFHHANAPLEMKKKKCFMEYFKCYLYSKHNWWGSYMEHVGKAWDLHKDNPNVLFLFYEDMKQNPGLVVRQLADFMNLRHSVSEQLIDEIVEATSFGKMKSMKEASEKEWLDLFGKESSLFRKGLVGDWKSTFTVAQNEEFDCLLNEWNKERQIPFTYQL